MRRGLAIGYVTSPDFLGRQPADAQAKCVKQELRVRAVNGSAGRFVIVEQDAMNFREVVPRNAGKEMVLEMVVLW